MKNTTLPSILVAMLAATAGVAPAQTFDSGSDGSYGALDITNTTVLDMPSNGVFHCTTIRVRTGANLSFRTNLLNTPVYLLATGDVLLESGSTISVNGKNISGAAAGAGGPGGFAGGFGPQQGYPAGDGQGPGAGRANNGYGACFAFPLASGNSNVYGNTLCVPLIGGSGGAGYPAAGVGGGGGGGAILIASSTKVTLMVSAFILANGGSGYAGSSGGAIRIVAPVVDGGGYFQVSGGGGGFVGGPGRVRIDTLDRFAWRGLGFNAAGKWTVGTQMFTGLNDPRRLDIVEAAGQTIALGSNPVSVTLGVGAPTNQTVRVRASGFTNDVPITVAVIPENGASTRYEAVIPITGGTPATNSVAITLPVDVVSNIQVWTR